MQRDAATHSIISPGMTLTTDLRYALRSLRRRPGWAAAAIITLALGIGANATMFSLVDRLLVRPPAHVREPDRVMRVALDLPSPDGSHFTMSTTSWPVFRDLQASSHAFATLAAVAGGDMVLGSGEQARSLPAAKVSGAYFAVLGASPALGRFIDPSDDQAPTGEPVAVISHALWRRAFASSADALAREIVLDQTPYRIIGVAPADFTGDGDAPMDVWVPLHAAMAQGGQDWTETRGLNLITIIGRLRDDASIGAATEQGSLAVARGMDGGAGGGARVVLTSLAPGWRERSAASVQGRVAVWVAAMSVLVFLIALVNVVNLMIFRAAARRREVAVRLALGAGRRHLTRQFVVESLVLATVGGLAAVFLAAWASEAMRALLLPGLAGSERLVSARLLGITGAATAVAGVLTGLVPAWRAASPALIDDLRTGGGAAGNGPSWIAGAFLSVQGGLCMLLLVAASLFILSLHRVRTQDFGFTSDGVLLAELRLPDAAAGPARDALYRQAEERIRQLPGVSLATVVQAVPFGSHHVPPIAVPDRPEFPDVNQQAPFLYATSPTYFRALGMRLLAGRNFADGDGQGSPLVVIVNQAMAEGLWPGENALGKCIRAGFVPGTAPTGIHASPLLPCRTVIGVVNNTRPRSIREEPGQARMQYYVPFGQIPAPPFPGSFADISGLLIRTTDADAMTGPVQRALQSATPGQPYAQVRPLQDLLDRQMRSWVLGATMFTVFGVLALGLGAIGLYGVRAYAVTQRTKEIGIRMALGARMAGVVRMVLLEGLRATGIGIVFGTIAAIGMARLVEPLLFETTATDPRVYGFVALLLVAVTIAASAVPAWRASRVDPNVALRSD